MYEYYLKAMKTLARYVEQQKIQAGHSYGFVFKYVSDEFEHHITTTDRFITKHTQHYFPCPTCFAASCNPLTLVHTGVRLSLDSAPLTDSVCRLLLAKIAYHVSL